MNTKHTPLELFLNETQNRLDCGIGYDPDDLRKWLPDIIRAVNCFDEMLKVLKSAHQFSCGNWPGECKGECNIAQAITKAEGGSQ